MSILLESGPMWFEIILLFAGLAILLAGGEMLVRSASSLALTLGISPLAVGLTVVAFGTSAPELFVNVKAAMSDTGALSFGNIFGSNMANIGLIIGMTAFLSPLPIQSVLTRRELPMLLLATLAFTIMSLDVELGDLGVRDVVSRGDGLVLLLFFVVFIYYTIGDLNAQRLRGGGSDDVSPLLGGAPDISEHSNNLKRDVTLTIVGLVGLGLGASLTVDASVDLARLFGVPEVIIGLTLVSLGTSLPELVAAIMAVRHKAVDMAVGSIVGSNIFNTLLIGGITATIEPLSIPSDGLFDLIITGLLTLTLMLASLTHRRIIIRYEGGVLFLIYISYMTYRII